MASLVSLGKSLLGFLGKQAFQNEASYHRTILAGLEAAEDNIYDYGMGSGAGYAAGNALSKLEYATRFAENVFDDRDRKARDLDEAYRLSYSAMLMAVEVTRGLVPDEDRAPVKRAVDAMRQRGWDHTWVHDELQISKTDGGSNV